MRFILSRLCIVCISLVVCTDNEEGNNQQSDSRIVWGKSIERVKIGDDSSSVIGILSEPDAITGDDFSGYIFNYTTGQSATMFISISEDSALGLGGIAVEVEAPYAGTTEEGIGIGTLREFAMLHHGEPIRVSGNTDIYTFADAAFYLVYDQTERVIRIQMSIPLGY